MAYAPHLKFSFGGELDPLGDAAWNEVWQCSVNCTSSTVESYDGHLVNMADDMSSFMSNPVYFHNPKARLSWLKLNPIGADGNYSDPTHPHTYIYPAPVPGGASAGGTYATDQSIVTTWTTSRLRGPGSKGRIYLPNAYPFAGGTCIISDSSQLHAVDVGRRLLDIMATLYATGDLVPVVASNVDASNTAITGVRVGRVIDVQRRRRDKVAEAYESGVWPA